jgi:hypothetical protein
MAEDIVRGDRVAYVATVDREGTKRVIYRNRDNSTRTVENGVQTESGAASDATTWWR